MGQSRFSENSGEAGNSIGKFIGLGIVAILGIILLVSCIGYNTGGYRTVIESRVSGGIDVKFTNGFYFTLFGKTTEYPDIMTVSFTKDETSSTVDIEPIGIRFNDATSATATGVVKFMLPKSDSLMVKMHKDYRNVDNLAITGFKPFVMECLKNSSQLMSSEMHYLGGRSTMSQYFQDQLEDGVYILQTEEKVVRDSVEKENKRVYLTKISKTKNGSIDRKKTMLTQYGIGITDAVISDVDYEERVDTLLGLKIDATSKTSISKQELMKAQQEALTEEAKGKKLLVETEYKELQNQKTQVIQAETEVKLAEQKVRLAEQDKLKQKAEFEASIFEAKKTKELADGEAYAKKAVMVADGALTQRLAAVVEINKNYAEALGKQPIVPSIMIGGGNGGAVPSSTTLVDMLMIKTAKDLAVDLNTKKGGN
jgi:SPFH domain / Band 7 family